MTTRVFLMPPKDIPCSANARCILGATVGALELR